MGQKFGGKGEISWRVRGGVCGKKSDMSKPGAEEIVAVSAAAQGSFTADNF